jgi:small subunit ribosomal protein S3
LGQKVNPKGLRLGITRTWDSVWYSQRSYTKWLHEDLKIKKQVKKEFYSAGISKIAIERSGERVKVVIYTAKPGVVVGRKGVGIDKIKKIISRIVSDAKDIYVNTEEVKRPEVDAQLVAENISDQLERRAHFRRAMKRAISSAMKTGAEGVKVQVSGRLGGAEMSRRERYQEGRTPLHTLRANIDYGFAEAKTTYGILGVKVWLSKNPAMEKKAMDNNSRRRDRRNFKKNSNN